ncbi:hypothetical protein ACTHGU_06255 [Chitinophagaceae bacterium MMS25-I14]
MRKVLAVFDGAHYVQALPDFASDLNNAAPLLLTGVFLPSVDYAAATSYLYYGNAVVPAYLEEYEEDPVLIDRNVKVFESFCGQHSIRSRVHRDAKKHIAKELKYETRYADLMLLSSAHFYENLGKGIHEEYLHDTLHYAECPVVLLPEKYVRPQSIIIAYDGTASCMHAIKQFVYLLPEFADLDVLIVYAGADDDDMPFTEMIAEYAARHFGNLAYYRLDADPSKYFNTWIQNKGVPMLVCGSFGRPFWSELFRKSFVADVIRDHKIPVFIAHL